VGRYRGRGPWAATVAIVALNVTALVRGWIVPVRTVDREQAILAKQHEALERVIQLQGERLDLLTEYARTADAILRSFPTRTPERQ
jgi:hypothetical protein